MMSFSMILPELFEYLTLIGGQNYKGFIVFLFSLTAIISRPFSAYLTDTIGRKPIILTGLIVCFVSGLLYPMVNSVFAFLCLRSFHGLAAGFTPTGNSAAVVDISSIYKRGEALGFIGFATSLGMTFGPVTGSWVKLNYGYNSLFLASSIVSFISLLIIFNTKETLPQKVDFHLPKISKELFLDPLVIFPALVYLFYILSYSIVFTLIPDFSVYLGIKNKGLFFLVSVGSSSLIRIIAGRLSDKIGRIRLISWGVFLLIVSMFLIGSAQDKFQFLMGGVLIGISVGIATPSVMAWCSDLADTKYLGRAFSSMFLSMEVGISLASVLSSFMYNNKFENLPKTFYLMSFFALVSLFFLYIGFIKQKSGDKISSW